MALVSLYVYGVRHEGRVGWDLLQSRVAPDRVLDELRKMDGSAAEARLIMEGAGDEGSVQEFEACEGLGGMVEQHGWKFDRVSRCWRAPEETVTEPEGTPLPVDAVALALGAPKFGWMHIKVSAAGQETTIHASHVFDPLPDLLDFAAAVEAGGTPSLYVEEEGVSHELITFVAAGERVRLVAIRSREEESVAVDVTVPRAALASALRGLVPAFLAFSDEQKAQWIPWWGGDEGEEDGDEAAAFPPEIVAEYAASLTGRLPTEASHGHAL
jgi:hypothetical protein